MITKEILDEQEKIVCKCGHRRLQHFVGGPISDCDKCSCKSYRPKTTTPKPDPEYSYSGPDGDYERPQSNRFNTDNW